MNFENIGESISLTEALEKVALYREAYPSTTNAVMFTRDQIDEILEQKDCIGLRIYFAKDEGSSLNTLVLVGTDSEGNDLLEVIKNRGEMSPPYSNYSSLLK